MENQDGKLPLFFQVGYERRDFVLRADLPLDVNHLIGKRLLVIF
jgi:hypothetical protein